jgi:hypothetical protein
MTSTISHNARRHADGTIDLDFYRAGATALRRRSMHDGKTLRAAGAGVLALAGAVALVILVAAGPMPASRGIASVAQTETAQIW